MSKCAPSGLRGVTGIPPAVLRCWAVPSQRAHRQLCTNTKQRQSRRILRGFLYRMPVMNCLDCLRSVSSRVGSLPSLPPLGALRSSSAYSARTSRSLHCLSLLISAFPVSRAGGLPPLCEPALILLDGDQLLLCPGTLAVFHPSDPPVRSLPNHPRQKAIVIGES